MLGELISAGANILGGLLGDAGKREEIALQKKLATQGVRMRVEDARAAGVHPAIALGASVPSYSPVGLGSGLAEGLSSAGQDISRAVASTSTTPERLDAFTQATQKLTLDRMGLENTLLASQIARLTQAGGMGPPMATGFKPDSSNEPTTLPTPFGLPALTVANPELAQDAENHFGDFWNEIYGALNWIDSFAQSVTGHNPRTWKAPGSPLKGETHAEYLRRMSKNPMY